MRHQLLAAGILAAAVASAATAQDGPYRRFTKQPIDPNRNDRVTYVPFGRVLTEERPATRPYDVSAATWYLQPLGARGVRASDTLEKAEYRLESFDATGGNSRNGGLLRVVITRSPAPPTDSVAPQLRVVHPDSLISSTATAKVETVPNGARYTFLVRPPHLGGTDAAAMPATARFELQFRPARDVKLPSYLTRQPGFGGADLETRMQSGPPGRRVEESVAGKRMEFRGK